MRREIRLRGTELVFMFLKCETEVRYEIEIGQVIFGRDRNLRPCIGDLTRPSARTNERENAANRDKFGSKRSYRCRTAVIIFITVYNAADRYLRLPTVRRGLDFMFFS